jgi:hypothetical protein
MENQQPQSETRAEPLSAGARYRAHLARFPERSCEAAPPPRRLRDLVRALRWLAWWSARRRCESR